MLSSVAYLIVIPHNLSLYNADSADISDLLASLPQWEFTGGTQD